jgi:hypothetical protein
MSGHQMLYRSDLFFSFIFPSQARRFWGVYRNRTNTISPYPLLGMSVLTMLFGHGCQVPFLTTNSAVAVANQNVRGTFRQLLSLVLVHTKFDFFLSTVSERHRRSFSLNAAVIPQYFCNLIVEYLHCVLCSRSPLACGRHVIDLSRKDKFLGDCNTDKLKWRPKIKRT